MSKVLGNVKIIQGNVSINHEHDYSLNVNANDS